MLSIAICDDDIQTTGKMESIIQKMAKQNLVNIETEVFWDGKSLVDAIINKNNFDLIYLDTRHTFLSCTDFLYNFDLSVCWYFEI